MSDDTKGAILLAVFAGISLLAGVSAIRRGRAFTRGEVRGVARWYFDAEISWPVRNLAFAQEPFGWAALGAAIALLGPLSGHHLATPALVLIGGGAFASNLVVGVARQIRPPQRRKPAWLRERENADSTRV